VVGTSLRRAFEIMEVGDFHPPASVTDCFGVPFDGAAERALEVVPFTEGKLAACRGTHILCCGYPLSIKDMWNRAPDEIHAGNWWYYTEAFALEEKVEPRWYLLRKEGIPGSEELTWDKKLALLGPTEVVPPACVQVFALVVHEEQTAQRLLPRELVWTASRTANGAGGVVGVGCYDADGVRIFEFPRELPGPVCGRIAAMEKPDVPLPSA
jgi:hypothetical protein